MTNALHAGLTEYFGVSLDGFNQSWAPQVLCQSCYVSLNEWLKKGTRGLLVKVPTLWSPPEVHIPGSIDSNCFFCQSLPRTCRTDPMPFYDGCVKRPVLRGKEAFPVRVLPDVPMEKDGSSSEEEEATSEDGEDPDWVPEDGLPLPYIGKLDQGMLNFLIQMLRLPKDAGQFLGSFLLNAELLLPGTTINQRNRSEQFEKFFAVQTIAFTEQKKDGSTAEIFREVVFCTDIIGLLQSQGVVHQPDQWLLFMDGSQKSFKCFLLHTEVDKSKRLPSVPILIGNQVPEKYETIKSVLAIINYSSYRWMVLADLKMINIISGLKMAACKFPCFLCRWDSKNTQKHYQPGQFKDWSENERIPGNFSFIKEPLVPADKVVLPELHIKIGIFQVFIKKLFKIHEENPHPAYEHYKEKYSISQEKLQVGALTGPEIRQLAVGVSSKFVEVRLCCRRFAVAIGVSTMFVEVECVSRRFAAAIGVSLKFVEVRGVSHRYAAAIGVSSKLVEVESVSRRFAAAIGVSSKFVEVGGVSRRYAAAIGVSSMFGEVEPCRPRFAAAIGVSSMIFEVGPCFLPFVTAILRFYLFF
ncbi:hypothetical protein TYRP_023389 [Tyrophagus putrescentiae]|nr:hypothetical protein TYRP_023389 [Tyrophagus putrescentiae]